MVESLVSTFKPVLNAPHPIEEIILIPSKGGRFEVTIDGDLVYSKLATGVHTTPDAVVEMVRVRLPKT